MKYHLIYNPTARSGKSKREFKIILEVLRSRKINFSYTITKKENEAIKIAKNINNKKTSIIVAVGGDGTIGEVITGIMEQREEERPILGALHVGTSPDFPRYHGIPTETEKAVNFMLMAIPAKIDLGKITCQNKLNNRELISHFGCNVNIGLGPSIASKSNNRYRTYLGDFGGTLLATLVSLIQHKKGEIRLEIDNKIEKINNLINLTVGKDPFLASGMRIPVNIAPDDGKLYLLILRSNSKIKLLSQIWRLYCGNILNYSGARMERCKKIIISAKNLNPIEFDGDVRGYLPATIEIIPQAIKLLKNVRSFKK